MFYFFKDSISSSFSSLNLVILFSNSLISYLYFSTFFSISSLYFYTSYWIFNSKSSFSLYKKVIYLLKYVWVVSFSLSNPYLSLFCSSIRDNYYSILYFSYSSNSFLKYCLCSSYLFPNISSRSLYLKAFFTKVSSNFFFICSSSSTFYYCSLSYSSILSFSARFSFEFLINYRALLFIDLYISFYFCKYSSKTWLSFPSSIISSWSTPVDNLICFYKSSIFS